MHVVELERSLRQLHLSGMASVLETRLRQALNNVYSGWSPSVVVTAVSSS